MKPRGVHLKEPGEFVACGWLYPTGNLVDEDMWGMVDELRCETCGDIFSEVDFMDHDVLRSMKYLEGIDISNLDA